jgi:excisionase family DNA binding protein
LPTVKRFLPKVLAKWKKVYIIPNMVKIDPNDLLTVTQAAELRGVTRQAINHLIQQGKLKVVEIAGKRFVRRGDVEGFEPDKGGRPSKSN